MAVTETKIFKIILQNQQVQACCLQRPTQGTPDSRVLAGPRN